MASRAAQPGAGSSSRCGRTRPWAWTTTRSWRARPPRAADPAARAGTVGAPWFAEAYVEGREFNLAVLDGPAGAQVLPPAEIIFKDFPTGKPRILGYAAKWHEDSFEYTHTVRTFDFRLRIAPAAGDDPVGPDLLEAAAPARLGPGGFPVDAAGRPWILEVNANPCLAPDAGFAAALDRAQIPFAQAVGRILAAAD